MLIALAGILGGLIGLLAGTGALVVFGVLNNPL
jgi:hypothetical protein